MQKIIFWLKAARFYTMPMTIMSWLVVFVWALSDGGNIPLGILTLFGILLAHLGTNLLDDYLDYKKGVQNIQNLKEKCWYIKSGEATLADTLKVVCVYFGLAALIGLFLTIKVGIGVAIIAAIAGVLCLFYSPCTYIGLGEVLVGLLFSPFLYLGTYYVMTHGFSRELMLMAISTGLLVVAVLYTHMLVDYDSDKADNKITICRLAGSKANALAILVGMVLLAYGNIALLIFLHILPLMFLITFLSLPIACKLYRLMREHLTKEEATHDEKYFHDRIETSIQLMAVFSVLICVAKLI
jgi:1,4-dihydroxy-2-naphthoate octaprenyltransferase